jgi:hypothetical protein
MLTNIGCSQTRPALWRNKNQGRVNSALPFLFIFISFGNHQLSDHFAIAE